MATQGRSFYILDELPLLRELNGALSDAGRELMPVKDTVRGQRRFRPGRGPQTAGRESAGRRRRLLLAQGEAEGRRDARVPGQCRQTDPEAQQQGARARAGGDGWT